MRGLRCDVYRPDEVAVVHVMAKTVRGIYMFGYDQLSLMCCNHRRQWIENQLVFQARRFGIDMMAYAIMSNHFHLILRSRPDVVVTWDDTEVARRWLELCPKRKNPDGSPKEPTDKELDAIRTKPKELTKIRLRLSDISWWMRLACQKIAQKANWEMNETGRFFDGRFKSVRLLDEQAILACMVYVDLNPIRAGVAMTLEESTSTSVWQRLKALHELEKPKDERSDAALAPIELKSNEQEVVSDGVTQVGTASPPRLKRNKSRCSDKGALQLSMMSYIELLDLTAKLPRLDKPGKTSEGIPPILTRLGIDMDIWKLFTREFSSLFSQAAGMVQTIEEARTLVTNRKYYCRAYHGRHI